MGVFLVFRSGGDGQTVHPQNHAFSGHDEFKVGIFLHGDKGISVPAETGDDFLAYEGLFGRSDVEDAHRGLEFPQPLVGGANFFRIGAVDGISAGLESHAEGITEIVGEENAALEFGTGQIAPAGDRGRIDFPLVDKQPH